MSMPWITIYVGLCSSRSSHLQTKRMGFDRSKAPKFFYLGFKNLLGWMYVKSTLILFFRHHHAMIFYYYYSLSSDDDDNDDDSFSLFLHFLHSVVFFAFFIVPPSTERPYQWRSNESRCFGARWDCRKRLLESSGNSDLYSQFQTMPISAFIFWSTFLFFGCSQESTASVIM